jgi:hypothetical protein
VTEHALDISRKPPTVEIFSKKHGARHWRRIGFQEHLSDGGRRIVTGEWQSACVVCGEKYSITTSARVSESSKGFQIVTCEAHRSTLKASKREFDPISDALTIEVSSNKHGTRLFRRIGFQQGATSSGKAISLAEWRSACVVCGETFSIVTPRGMASNKSQSFSVTTCVAHRQRHRGSAAVYRDPQSAPAAGV